MRIGEYSVTVRDKKDNVLTNKQLAEKTIDYDLYYVNMKTITDRINRECGFDKVS